MKRTVHMYGLEKARGWDLKKNWDFENFLTRNMEVPRWGRGGMNR